MEHSISQTDAWDHLTSWHRQWGQPIQIIITESADASAALHVLLALFRSYRIMFEVHPVLTVGDIEFIVNKVHMDLGFPENVLDEEPLADGEADEEGSPEAYFFCLGCGLQADLSGLFRGFRHCKAHILDSHRPVNITNLLSDVLFATNRLYLWNREAIVEGIDGFFRQQRLRLRQKRRRVEEELGGAFASDEDEDESEEDRLMWRTGIEAIPQSMLAEYNASLASGRSVALELCDFSILINRHQQGFLWSAAIGVTDLFMRRLCDRVTYSGEILKLRDAVNRHRAANSGSGQLSNGYSSPTSTEQVSLLPSLEYPAFFMLRHWSLWSALMFQPEICNALELFTDSGEARLQSLLAECGVSRKVAEKSWTELSQEDRNRILPLLAEILKECVPEFTINSISRAVGYSIEVTAFDACRLFNAQWTAQVPIHEASTIKTTGTDNNASATELVTRRLAAVQRDLFWKAHEVLVATSHSQLFKSALDLAKQLQCDISLATSSLTVQRGAIHDTRTMYYCPVSERTSQAVESFWTPARIMTLADSVVQTLTVIRNRQRQVKQLKPLVIACAIPSLICSAHKQDDAANALTQQQFIVGYAHEQRVLKSRPFQPLPIVHHVDNCVSEFLKEDATAVHEQHITRVQNLSLSGIERRWLIVTGQDRTNHLVEAIHLSLNNNATL